MTNVDPVQQRHAPASSDQDGRRAPDRAAPADVGAQLERMALGKRDGDEGRLRAYRFSRLEPGDRLRAQELAKKWGQR